MGERARIGRSFVVALMIAAMATLLAMFAIRALGPNDLWDQTQPKTVSYTTDIVANGNWILPIERGEFPATKPPLYNWLAAPFVALLGYSSEVAHKFPSVLAMVVCWVVMARLGQRLGKRAFGEDDARAHMLGWGAALALPANYALFKLGYLARPDMLLTLWITLGWIACTAVFIDAHDERRRAWPVVFFWSCVALAALTKGPPAVLLLLYAVIGAKVVAGRWRAVHRLQWWWGLPVAMVLPAAWLFAAWRVNPEHVYEQLWYAEIWGRVTGRGPEGSHGGPMDIVLSLHKMPLYFAARFAPWSVLSIIGMAVLLTRDRRAQRPRWRTVPHPLRCWLLGAMLLVVITVGIFSLSAGKRADYIAPCYPAAALLAAWVLTQLQVNVTRRALPAAIGAAVVTMIVMAVDNEREPAVDVPGFSDRIEACIDDIGSAMAERPARVVFFRDEKNHLQAMLGYSMRDDAGPLDAAMEAGDPFWVVTSRRHDDIPEFRAWFATRNAYCAEVTAVVRCPPMPKTPYWPIEVGLYRVQPGKAKVDSRKANGERRTANGES